METIRYRALYRIIYARALLALVEYSRERPHPPVQFGPLDITKMERNGLTVTGTDLTGVAAVLAKVHGLVEVLA
jgi:hypothetical protein